MKVLTVAEPWASLIAKGKKTIETRTHRRFRGLFGERIAIHAGGPGIYDKNALEMARRLAGKKGLGIISNHFSTIVCTAEVWQTRWLYTTDSEDALVDCQNDCSLFGLFLRNIEPECGHGIIKGKQGIWNWEPEPLEIRTLKFFP